MEKEYKHSQKQMGKILKIFNEGTNNLSAPRKTLDNVDANDMDYIVNELAKKRRIDDLLREDAENKQKQNMMRNKAAQNSIGNYKKTKNSKVKRAVDTITATLIISACAAALISAGILIGKHVVEPISDRFTFEKDLTAAIEIVTEDARRNLEHLNLGYTDENGKFILNDNEVSDYAALNLIDPKPAEIRAYMEAIDNGEENYDFIRGVYYTENGLERTYISQQQYYNINGFSGYVDFSNITESQLVNAYNNGTIYEVVHDLTKTQNRGGR